MRTNEEREDVDIGLESKAVLALAFSEILDVLPDVKKVKSVISSWVKAEKLPVNKVEKLADGETISNDEFSITFKDGVVTIVDWDKEE